MQIRSGTRMIERRCGLTVRRIRMRVVIVAVKQSGTSSSEHRKYMPPDRRRLFTPEPCMSSISTAHRLQLFSYERTLMKMDREIHARLVWKHAECAFLDA